MNISSSQNQSVINPILLQIRSSGRMIDLICIILLAALNPLTYTLFADSAYSQPDTFAYISQAINFLENGQLHTGPFGHIDSSLILPPLFPWLISILMLPGIDGLTAAVKISQFSGILFSFLGYFLIRKRIGYVGSLITMVALQLTSFYFNVFSTPLTEAVFLLMLLAGFHVLLFSLNPTRQKGLISFFVCGMVCSLVFFSRDIGLAFLVSSFIIILLHNYHQDASPDSKVVLKTSMLIFGFFIFVIPYFIVTYLQTSQPLLTKSFRMGNYSVSVEDDALIKKIEAIHNIEPVSYEIVRQKRRELMQLLPDGSEMLDYVNEVKQGKSQKPDLYNSISSRMEGYPDRLKGNVLILYYQMGAVVFTLFILLFCISVAFFRSHRDYARILIPSFIILYLLALSVFTDLVGRYLKVLLPVILIFMYMETIILCSICLDRYTDVSKKLSETIAASVLTLFLIYFSAFFTGGKVYFPMKDISEGTRIMRMNVDGEPVFTFFPFYAHSVGGKFRVLPNDNLDKISTYGKLTGVRWILLVETGNNKDTKVGQYWDKANQWINSDLRDNNYLNFCCGLYDQSRGMGWRLYELK